MTDEDKKIKAVWKKYRHAGKWPDNPNEVSILLMLQLSFGGPYKTYSEGGTRYINGKKATWWSKFIFHIKFLHPDYSYKKLMYIRPVVEKKNGLPTYHELHKDGPLRGCPRWSTGLRYTLRNYVDILNLPGGRYRRV